MNAGRTLTCLVLVLTIAGSGALAPVPAAAQSQSEQPDMYQDAVKASPSASEHEGAYEAGAVVASIGYAPGKAILCGIGVASGFMLMLLTFGSGYGAAKAVAEEGCGGAWIVTADDLRAANAQRGITQDAHLR